MPRFFIDSKIHRKLCKSLKIRCSISRDENSGVRGPLEIEMVIQNFSGEYKKKTATFRFKISGT